MAMQQVWCVSFLFVAILVLLVQSDRDQSKSGSSRSGDGTSLPVGYPAKLFPESGAVSTCPNDEESQRFRETIDTEIRAILRQRVIPVLFPAPCALGQCERNPAASCSQLAAEEHSSYASGGYWVWSSNGSAVEVFCDMSRRCCNSSAAGWARVAYLNMTDRTQECPTDEFLLVDEPRRSCGKENSGCISAIFHTFNIQYTRVCGKVIGYQYGEPDAFKPYYRRDTVTIDGQYVDGVSITHGQSPRQHIWTFAAAQDETQATFRTCPCTLPSATYTGRLPPFIGNDYFCETGSRDDVRDEEFYADDPLWDGQGCGVNSSCCRRFSNLPWFCKTLPNSTSDDIEVRLCSDSGNIDEGTPIELIELYIQ